MSEYSDTQLDRPVLITGAPRSGKSFVGNILKQAPEFAYFGEPLHLWHVVPQGRDHDCLSAADSTPALATRIVNRCRKAMIARDGLRYMDNLAHHALAIPFIHAVMPTARIIHVVREPEGAVPEMAFAWTQKVRVVKTIIRRRNSWNFRSLPRQGTRFFLNLLTSGLIGRRRTTGPRVPGLQKFAHSHSATEIAAFQWMNIVQIARRDLAELPASLWVEVKFEELLRDPPGQFRRLAEFVEVNDVDAISRYAPTCIHLERLDKRKKVIPSAEEWGRILSQIERGFNAEGLFA